MATLVRWGFPVLGASLGFVFGFRMTGYLFEFFTRELADDFLGLMAMGGVTGALVGVIGGGIISRWFEHRFLTR